MLILILTNSNNKCPHKRQKKNKHKGREISLVMIEAETGFIQSQPRNARSHQKLKEARKDSLPEPSEGSRPI